ncbi:MAG TPA: prepilin-type N-terminal cleavage/methylation domain-containing protein [Syntrophales bacterium]|jgi:prepilin-type N-terminal cleavage/methylation domain-containing protein|nr:prepilin-type N-terminal cleavage/methylation domain-containing protein [Syntrophales bacterium]
MKTNEKGFTLVELLATIGAGLILLAAIATAVTFGYRSSVAVERKVTAVEDARAALELMATEIRMASYNPTFALNLWAPRCDGVGANQTYRGIQEATANNITVQMDISENSVIGDANEIIRYSYDVGNQRITRLVNCQGGAQPFLGDAVANVNQRTVLVINNDLNIPVFRYFNGSGLEIQPETNPAVIPDIRRVDITLAVQTEHVDPNTNQRRTLIYSTSVIPRNHAPVM